MNPAYSRITPDGTGWTVRGFPGRRYTHLAGAKSAARFIHAKAIRDTEQARLAYWSRPRTGTKSSIYSAGYVTAIQSSPSAPPPVRGVVPDAEDVEGLFDL